MQEKVASDGDEGDPVDVKEKSETKSQQDGEKVVVNIDIVEVPVGVNSEGSPSRSANQIKLAEQNSLVNMMHSSMDKQSSIAMVQQSQEEDSQGVVIRNILKDVPA